MDKGEGKAFSEKLHLHVVVATGDHAVYDGSVDRVTAPAVNGQISILVHHAPLLAALEPGELVVRSAGQAQSFAIGGGVVEVRDNQVIILADTAERAEEIDVARAEAARLRASTLVKQYRGRPEFATALQALRRSRARLKVARSFRGRPTSAS
jgi:F-type H+-transporting ATPase subunit epsilon